MDPESGLDAIRNIGISDGVVRAITEDALTGRHSRLRVRQRRNVPTFSSCSTRSPRLLAKRSYISGTSTRRR